MNMEKGINIQNGPYTISRTGKVEKMYRRKQFIFLVCELFSRHHVNTFDKNGKV